MPTKTLPYQTFDAVSVHRSAEHFFRYRQTQTRVAKTVIPGQEEKVAVTALSGIGKHPLKSRCFQQTPAAGKTLTLLLGTQLIRSPIRHSAWPDPWHVWP